MDDVIGLLLLVLVAAAVVPLAALGVFVIADRLGWAGAGRLLDLTSALMRAQWAIGGVISGVIGLALIALGAWLFLSSSAWEARVAGVILVPFGLWRIWRGISVLRSGRNSSTESPPASN